MSFKVVRSNDVLVDAILTSISLLKVLSLKVLLFYGVLVDALVTSLAILTQECQSTNFSHPKISLEKTQSWEWKWGKLFSHAENIIHYLIHEIKISSLNKDT